MDRFRCRKQPSGVTLDGAMRCRAEVRHQRCGVFWCTSLWSAGVTERGQSIEHGEKQRTSGPSAGQGRPQPRRGLFPPRPDLEQPQANGAHRGACELGAAEEQATKEDEEVVGERVELKAKGVAPVLGARQPLGFQITAARLPDRC
jgi:hypothetical protein